MAAIYIHIPFCRQACHYCDFHFSTSLKAMKPVLQAIRSELRMRRDELSGSTVSSVYIGGGTPSLIGEVELMSFFELLYTDFQIAPDAEITLEANPDDLDRNRLMELRRSPVNRLSIGVQSFRDEDLRLMNRAHDATQALRCIPEAADAGFDNVSVDLMFGLPGLTDEAWMYNVTTALSMPVTHLSCYGLTVEPRTALHAFILKGRYEAPDEAAAAWQYRWLLDESERRGLPWYEISNFSRPGSASRHNTSYWQGKPYLGAGPSAHSYDGKVRSWNISNNARYVKAVGQGERLAETEILGVKERFNETVLTSLRVRTGLSLTDIRNNYGPELTEHLGKAAEPFIESGWLSEADGRLALTMDGLLFADRITSSLFKV